MDFGLRGTLSKFQAALHLDDPPRRIALALAVGVFIGCTPLYGLQTLLSIVVAIALRLNRAATVAGTWLNLPWFAPFVYGVALGIGTLIVPDRSGRREAWLDFVLENPALVSWHDVPTLLREISPALIVGTVVVGGVAAAVTYFVALGLIQHRRARRAARRRSGSGPRTA